MATVSATFTFGLPEDTSSDQLLIYEATSRNGTYSLVSTVDYEYGDTSYEYDSADTVKWYKIKFNNSTDSEAGPLSDAVYGGDFNNSTKPFLAVSTGSDGANYATSQDVYNYANLTPEDVARSKVEQALRRARAIIDLKTAELDLDRFTKTFNTDTARKKYNATMRIVKEAEINIALGNLYRNLSDDYIIEKHKDSVTNVGENFDTISVGGQSLSFSNQENYSDLLSLSNRYMSIGASLLEQLQPPSVRLHYKGDLVTSPKFKYPFNGY